MGFFVLLLLFFLWLLAGCIGLLLIGYMDMKELSYYDPNYLKNDNIWIILIGPVLLLVGIGFYITDKINLEKINKWIWNLAHRKDEDN